MNPATRSSRSLLWMLRAALLFAGVLLPPALASTACASDRPIQVGLGTGSRSFENRLDLTTEAGVGLRLGLGLNRNVTLLLDAIQATPTRKTTNQLARVTALRSLIQVGYSVGPVRPYIVGGAGGILFDFNDTADAAGGAFTGGLGIEWRVARQIAVFGEGSIDWYRSRTVLYGVNGEELSSSPRTTDQARTIEAGVLASF
ncbi:MAG: outer membrane beta-barrel protein [Bacteroidota bacterium]